MLGAVATASKRAKTNFLIGSENEERKTTYVMLLPNVLCHHPFFGGFKAVLGTFLGLKTTTSLKHGSLSPFDLVISPHNTD